MQIPSKHQQQRPVVRHTPIVRKLAETEGCQHKNKAGATNKPKTSECNVKNGEKVESMVHAQHVNRPFFSACGGAIDDRLMR